MRPNLIETWLLHRFGELKTVSNETEWVIKCPFCGEQKGKFYISRNNNLCHCFRCGASLHLATLMSKIEKVPFKVILKQYNIQDPSFSNNDINSINNSFNEIIYDDNFTLEKRCVPFPDELIYLNPYVCNSYVERDALRYLYSRGITPSQVEQYKMSVTKSGIYKNRVIIPIKDGGKNKFYIARAIYPQYKRKELSPKANWWNWSKSEVLFGLDNALENGNGTIVLCEGIFDALAWKFNGVSMLGKSLYKKQLARLFEIEKQIQKVYICLDYDAQSDVYKIADKLSPIYKERLYIVQIPEQDDDPNGYIQGHTLTNLYTLLDNAIPYNKFYSLDFKKDLMNDTKGYMSTPLIIPREYPSIDMLDEMMATM